jgi:hypothetical protein
MRPDLGSPKSSVELCPGLDPGPIHSMRQTLLSEDTSSRDPRHGLPAARGLPLRSHNSLLYDDQSTNACAPHHGHAREGISVLLAASQHLISGI